MTRANPNPLLKFLNLNAARRSLIPVSRTVGHVMAPPPEMLRT